VLVGDEEMNSNTFTLKNMVSGNQSKLSLQDLISEVQSIS
jgi:histidyl-tRNA synthetase